MKTIYLLHTRLGTHLGGIVSGFTIAFECRECAELQAGWYRRDKVPVTVAEIQLYESIRDGVMNDCRHLRLHHSSHEHVPVTMGARKGE